jgi:integrase/recombinase XerD
MRRNLRAERVKLPRVHRMVKGGVLYKWHRVTRAKLPSDIPEDHPDFIAAWTAEEGRKPAPKRSAGSILSTWQAFKATSHFRGMSNAYRAAMIRHAEAAMEAYGAAAVADLRDRHIRADLEKLEPHAAVARLKMWRLLCTYAKHRGLAPVVATDGIKKARTPAAQNRAPWTMDEIEAYRESFPIGSPQRLCFELLYWTGARTNDAVRLTRSMVGDDGLLVFRQSKTRHEAIVPWTSALPSWAVHMEPDRSILRQCIEACTGFTFLETQGRARSFKGLSNTISRSAATAGIIGKSAHGLRATRLTMIAESGGSAHAIMTWGGHKTLTEAEQYTRKADRRKVLLGTEHKPNPVNLSVNQK